MKRVYPVITLCGSTRFRKEFEEMQKELTLKGNIVVSVGLFGHNGDAEVWENAKEGTLTQTKIMLDDMHKKKIDMSDSIYVINPQGYIGTSTWSEICYAKMLGKKIDFMEPVSDDKIKEITAEHIRQAETLAWKQIDYIRHSDGYYVLDDFAHFSYKRKEIVDPWINVETHYNGEAWINHSDPEQAVDPFVYYGKEKVATFVEKILLMNDQQ